MAFQIFSKSLGSYLNSLDELKFAKEGAMSWAAKCGAKRVLKRILSNPNLETAEDDLIIVGSKGRNEADPKKRKPKAERKARRADAGPEHDLVAELIKLHGVNKKCAKCAKACKEPKSTTIIQCPSYVKA